MSKKEQFDLYLSDNWGCDSVRDFAMKVVDALDDGKIEDIIEVTEFIKTNYGNACCSAFLYHFKGIYKEVCYEKDYLLRIKIFLLLLRKQIIYLQIRYVYFVQEVKGNLWQL